MKRPCSLTGTVDHSLTENLMVRAEVRWEKGSLDKGPNHVFYQKNTPGVYTWPLGGSPGKGGPKSSQVLFGVEAIYEF